MPPLSVFSRSAFASFALAIAVASGACGTDEVKDVDYGAPPDPSRFDPGKGSGDGYGYGGDGTGPTPTSCPEELRTCTHEFTYPVGTETSVELRGDFGAPESWERGVVMTKDGNLWKGTATVPSGKPVQYKFFVDGTTWVIDPLQPRVDDAQGNTNNVFAGTTCEKYGCAEQGALPPGIFDWRDSVMYFVFVDRFFDGGTANCNVAGVSGKPANYQGGDWPGVTQKINEGYFTDLGVNTLWLTVPVKNANTFAGQGVGESRNYSSYHGYWPSDLEASEPCFGTDADLKALVTAAHAKNIKVLFDFAMVHMQKDAAVYKTHGDWFWPNDNGKGGNCVCGQGCQWDPLPDRERCWFTDYLPHWNYTVPAARDYSVGTAIKLAKDTNADGFRLDAIKHVDISWLTELRTRLKTEILGTAPPEQRFYLVGETYDFGNRDALKAYVDPQTKLDGQFDFPLRAHLAQALLLRTESLKDLASFMDGNDYFYGAKAIMSPFIGNHDLPRVIHLAQNAPLWNDQGAGGKDRAWDNLPPAVAEKEAFERVANAFAVLFTNRGAPLLYYGDEVGLAGAGDPDNRRPMPWTGLSADQTALRDRVKKLLAIRAGHPALRRGTRVTQMVNGDGDLWVYRRTTTGDDVYVAVNRGDATRTATGLPSGALRELVTDQDVSGPTFNVPARQTRIFVAK